MNRTIAMKSHSYLFSLTAAVVFPSCTNTAFVGHDRAYDLNVGLAADLTKVVALNAGFEGKSYAAVPPEQPLNPIRLLKSGHVAKGEVLSTLSALKIQRLYLDGTNGAATVDFIASTATGEAADAVAAKVKANGASATEATEGTVAGNAADITAKTQAIPKTVTKEQGEESQ